MRCTIILSIIILVLSLNVMGGDEKTKTKIVKKATIKTKAVDTTSSKAKPVKKTVTKVKSTEKEDVKAEVKAKVPEKTQIKKVADEKQTAKTKVPAKRAVKPSTSAKKEKTAVKPEKPVKKEKTVVKKPASPLKKEKKAVKKAEMSEVSVARSAICTGFEDREPTGSAEKFPKGIQKIYCFSHIKGVMDTIEIVHKWYYNDQIMGTVPLKIKSSSWRTRSAKTIAPEQTGAWRVDIINSENGEVLKTLNFTIE